MREGERKCNMSEIVSSNWFVREDYWSRDEKNVFVKGKLLITEMRVRKE